MFPRPITNASFKTLPSLTPFLSRALPRTASAAVPSRCAQPRSFPSLNPIFSSSTPYRNPIRTGTTASRGYSRATNAHFLGRPFSSSAQQCYGFGNQSYKRFGGRGRQATVTQLLANAKPHHFVIIGLVISGFYIYNSETVEVTGRRRFNVLSADYEVKMGQDSYREVLSSSRGKILPENHPDSVVVRRILNRLIPYAPIKGADWRVHVIKDDKMMNAFVLPGGKVFVYTGILPVCGNEDGLAAVLGHEIAHVVAHHPAERMSNSLITMGAVLLISMLFDISGQIPSLLLNLMYSLPNSRTQEVSLSLDQQPAHRVELTQLQAEADEIGLMMMSKACYNPEAAAKLWSRMQKMEKEAPPQFLSTHPSSYNREEAIRDRLSKAQATYEESGCASTGDYMAAFRQASNGNGW